MEDEEDDEKKRESVWVRFWQKKSEIPYIKCVGNDPTVEIDPPKQKLKSAVDRSIGP